MFTADETESTPREVHGCIDAEEWCINLDFRGTKRQQSAPLPVVWKEWNNGILV